MTAESSIAPADAGGQQPAPLLITGDEYRALELELGRLRALRDGELLARRRDARTFVTADAVEEGAQMRAEQAVLDARILAIQDVLSTAKIDDGRHGAGVVGPGSSVAVCYERTGRRATYVMTGTGVPGDVTSASARSPIGMALLGRRAGDVVAVELPRGGVERLRILDVAPGRVRRPGGVRQLAASPSSSSIAG